MAQVRLPVRRGDWLRARLTSVYGPLVRWRAPLVLLAMGQGAANRWAVTDVHGIFIAWRSDNRTMIIMSAGNPQPLLYDLTTQKASKLEPNSDYYIWAN